MNVRDGDYDAGGALLAFAGSVQLLWLIVALVVLPIDARPLRRLRPHRRDAGRWHRHQSSCRRARQLPGRRAGREHRRC